MSEVLFPSPTSKPVTGVLLAVSITYTLLALITMATMLQRRHRRLLAVREPFLILLETSFGLATHLVTMVTIIRGQTTWNCEVLSYLYSLFLPLWALPYFMMFPTVVLGSDLNRLKVSHHSAHVAPLQNPLPPSQLEKGERESGEKGEQEEGRGLGEGASSTVQMVMIGRERGKGGEEESMISTGSDWRWRVKRLATLRGKLLVILAACLVHMGGFLGLRYIGGGQEGSCLQETLLVISAGEVLYGLLLLFFLIRIFSLKDPFFMKIELILNSLAFFPLLFLSFLYPIIPASFPTWFDIRYLFVVSTILGYLFNCLFPTILSFEAVQRWIARRLQQEMNQEELRGLDQKGEFFLEGHFQLNSKEVMKAMLEDQVMLEAFTHYAVRNWCVENILFYKSASEFASQFQKEGFDAPGRATRIIKEFIENRSPLEVNIENQLRQTILVNFRQGLITPDLFLRAQNAICDLMYRDSFQKWIKTPGFKDALLLCVGTQRKGSAFGNSIRNLQRRLSTGSLVVMEQIKE